MQKILNAAKQIRIYEIIIYLIIAVALGFSSYQADKAEFVDIRITYESSLSDENVIIYVDSVSENTEEKGYVSTIKMDGTSSTRVDNYDTQLAVRIETVISQKPVMVSKVEILKNDKVVADWEGKELTEIFGSMLNVAAMESEENSIEVVPNNGNPVFYMSDGFCAELLNAMQGNWGVRLFLYFVGLVLVFVVRLLIELYSKEMRNILRVGCMVLEIVMIGVIGGVGHNLQNMVMLIPLLSVVMWGYIIFYKTGDEVKASFMPLLAVCIIGMLLLLTGYMNFLYIGTIIVFLAGAVLFAYCLRKNSDLFKRYLTDYGTIFFLLLAAMLISLHCFKDINIHNWDEFSHWGPFFKNIFLTNAMPAYADYPMTHGSYPQIISVLYYYFSFLIKEYNDASIYAVMMIMISACATTLFSVFSEKSYRLCIMMVGIIASTFLALFPDVQAYSSILQDALVGIMAGGIVLLIYSLEEKVHDKKYIGLVAFVLMAYVQIKTSGLPMALLCCGFYFICCLATSEKIDKKSFVKALTVLVIMAVAVAVFYVLPKQLYSIAGVVDITEEATRIDASGIDEEDSDIVLEPPLVRCYNDWKENGKDSFWAKMTRAFLQGLWTRKVGMLSGLGWILAFILAGVIIKWRKKVELKDRIVLTVIPVSVILLLLALYLAYMRRIFVRALLLPSYERYITPLIIGCVMLLFSIGMKYGFQRENNKKNVIVLGGVAVLCSAGFIINETENYFANQITLEEAGKYRYKIVGEQLADCVENDSIIYVISQGNVGNVAYGYRLQLLSECTILEPLWRTAPISCSIAGDSMNDEGGVADYKEVSVSRFQRNVVRSAVDYILVNYTDDILRDGYGELFSDGLTTGQDWDAKLYKVESGEEKYQLVGVLYEN